MNLNPSLRHFFSTCGFNLARGFRFLGLLAFEALTIGAAINQRWNRQLDCYIILRIQSGSY